MFDYYPKIIIIIIEKTKIGNRARDEDEIVFDSDI